jgi:methionyl-tRNA synthetase
MNGSMKKFFITTPIYYPNARPHVGSAYTTIVCDVIARYKRMCGYDVAFLTGTDEHGEKLRRAAEEAGISPAEFVAEKRKLFTKLWAALGIPEYSRESPAGYRFVHTSQNPDHVKSVHWMIRQAKKAGYIEPKKYEGRYCIYDERYVSDSTEPANCDICGRPAELISEENYFFKLSAFQDRLLKLYDERPEFVRPDFRMNEVKSFVKSGLRDISISRKRLKWGIPWPDDPEQVVYVWYDALTSYLTGIGFRGLDETGRDSDFYKYWMDPEAERVHMIGKDILRFHAVYWPAFLMAANDALPEEQRLPLPSTIFAHGWIYYEQDKMSKSKGNVVYPEPIVEALDSLGAPGNDALRYYLLRDTPFGQDASFSYEGLIQRYNSDLANGFGNLASRTVAMLRQFCGAAIPRRVSLEKQQGTVQMIIACQEAYDKLDFSSALSHVSAIGSEADKLIVQTRPWDLAKSGASSDHELLEGVLYAVAQVLRVASVLAFPAVPEGARRVWGQLGQDMRLEDERIDETLKFRLLAEGKKVGKPEPIFPRLDKAATQAKLELFAEADRAGDAVPGVKFKVSGGAKGKKEVSTHMQDETSKIPGDAAAPSPVPAGAGASPGEKISIEDFAKVEMRVGEIVSAERIPKADKLLKLMVDIGTEVRQVLAGIAQFYEPEKLVGRKVVVVTNLQPRKMRGLESNGMIVAASVGDEGRPVLATFAEEVPKGAKLK